MPLYAYVHPKSGDREELFLTLAERAARERDGRIRIGRRWFVRDMGQFGGAKQHRRGKWPILSVAAGVNPSDVKAEMEHCRKQGVAVNFTDDGRAIFESHAHRRQALKAMGLQDKRGYD